MGVPISTSLQMSLCRWWAMGWDSLKILITRDAAAECLREKSHECGNGVA